MIIRDYQPEDFSQVVELWQQTGIYTTERGDTAGLIRQCNQQGGKFLVLEDPVSGKPAGTSWMTWDGRRVFLHHFAIRPDLQGRGLGRELAVRSMEFARTKGCPVKLEVHRQNRAAVRLYQSLGFESFGDYDVMMKLNP